MCAEELEPPRVNGHTRSPMKESVDPVGDTEVGDTWGQLFEVHALYGVTNLPGGRARVTNPQTAGRR